MNKHEENKVQLGRAVLYIFLAASLAGCNKPASETKATTVKTKAATPASPIDTLIKKATSGDANAQFELSKKYSSGDGLSVDMEKAREWRDKAAAQDHAEAKLSLAKFYERPGVDQDKSKSERLYHDAFQLFSKAAKKGDSNAKYRLGLMHFNGEGLSENKTLGIDLLQQSALGGNGAASFKLYWIYNMTVYSGVKRDTKKASEWLLKSATQGYSEAQYELGRHYLNGILEFGPTKYLNNGYIQDPYDTAYYVIPKDMAKALEYLQLAALQNHTDSQMELGDLYYEGAEGIPKSYVKATEWFMKAATRGNAKAQFRVSVAYLTGDGIGQDIVLGYAWLNLAAAQETDYDLNQKVQRYRDTIRARLTKNNLAEAEKLSASWKDGMLLSRNTTTAPSSGGSKNTGKLQNVGAGTSFYVSQEGHLVTNKHVVFGCAEMRLQGKKEALQILARDEVNDLALLKQADSAPAVAVISPSLDKVRQGQEVVVYGFPLNNIIAAGGNLTPGVISALTGLGNNTNQIQITAPIQPGSSGSPLMDKKGHVIGVVNMKLSESDLVKSMGSLPQNVNFAINGSTLRGFLDANKVPYETGRKLFSFDKSLEDIGDEARKSTVVVECWK